MFIQLPIKLVPTEGLTLFFLVISVCFLLFYSLIGIMVMGLFWFIGVFSQFFVPGNVNNNNNNSINCSNNKMLFDRMISTLCIMKMKHCCLA